MRNGQNRNSKRTQNTCFCPKPVEHLLLFLPGTRKGAFELGNLATPREPPAPVQEGLRGSGGILGRQRGIFLRALRVPSARQVGAAVRVLGAHRPRGCHLVRQEGGTGGRACLLRRRRQHGRQAGEGGGSGGGRCGDARIQQREGRGRRGVQILVQAALVQPGLHVGGGGRRQQVEGQAEGRGGRLREGRPPAQRHERAEQRGLRAQERAARLQFRPLGRGRRVPGWLLLDGGAALLRFASVAAVGVRVVLRLGAGLSPLDDRHAAGGAIRAGGGRGPSAARRAAGDPARGHLWRQELGGHGVQVADELCAARLPGCPALKAREVLQDFFGAGLKPRVERIQVGLDRRFQRALP